VFSNAGRPCDERYMRGVENPDGADTICMFETTSTLMLSAIGEGYRWMRMLRWLGVGNKSGGWQVHL